MTNTQQWGKTMTIHYEGHDYRRGNEIFDITAWRYVSRGTELFRVLTDLFDAAALFP